MRDVLNAFRAWYQSYPNRQGIRCRDLVDELYANSSGNGTFPSMLTKPYCAFPGPTRPNDAKEVQISSWLRNLSFRPHAITVSLAESFDALFPIDVV